MYNIAFILIILFALCIYEIEQKKCSAHGKHNFDRNQVNVKH